MTDVGEWLESLGLSEYAESFESNRIDWALIPDLDHELLKELGVTLVGDRMRLLRAAAQLASLPDKLPVTARPISGTVPSGDAERRQLTVMFCDLVGSTALSEGMDTEDYRELLGAYQTAAGSAIREHDGYIARYMGDGLLVYFGYPVAQENDPERAARAGLAVIGAVSALDRPIPLKVRVGIATGPVVVGDIVGEGASEEAAVLGETPNLAARLQGAAAPNTVLLSATTQQLLGGRVETEALAVVELKGLSRPIVPYRAVRPRSLSEVSETRLDSTPLIGRDVEVALLERAWVHALSSEGQAVLLSGEPGVGKSRLLRAFQENVTEHERTRVQWYCSPYYQTTANYPAIEQLKHSVQLDQGAGGHALDSLTSMGDRLGLDSAEWVPPLAVLLSVPLDDRYVVPQWSPDELKRRLIQAQIELLLAAAKHAPVLFIIEDLHWADPTTLEVLGEMVTAIRSERVLMLMTARLEFSPPWTEQAHAITQRLTSLSRNETMALVQSIAEDDGLSPDVIKQIVERTDGVPLFVEELTKSLLESSGEVGVPASLQDSLMARLDRLGPTKELAQMASVIGRSFSLDALTPLAENSPEVLERGLGELVDSGLVYRRAGGEYEFKHALIQDAAYETLLMARRRALHARVANVLESSSRSIGESQPELLAHHWSAAGENEKAIVYWTQAARDAASRSAHREALAHCGRGLSALNEYTMPTDVRQEQLALLMVLCPSFMALEGYDSTAVQEAYSRARVLCEEVGNFEQMCVIMRGIILATAGKNVAAAIPIADEFLGRAKREQQALARLVGHYLLAILNFFHGDLEEAHVHSTQAIELYNPEEHSVLAVTYGMEIGQPTYVFDGWTRVVRGDDTLGLQQLARGLALAERSGHIYSVIPALCFTAMAHCMRGSPIEAKRYAEHGIALCHEHGHEKLLVWFAIIPTWVEASMTSDLASIPSPEQAPGRMSGGGLLAMPLQLLAGEIEYMAERPAAALEALAIAQDVLERSEARVFESALHRLRALVAWSQSALTDAETYLLRAVEVAKNQSALLFELKAATSLAQLWSAQGRSKEAYEMLREARARCIEPNDAPYLREAEAVLKSLRCALP